GELVEIEVNARTRPAQGRLLRVIEPSPERREPACPHLDACGGCDWMHLSARAQEAGHASIVRAAIAHAVPGVPLPEIAVHEAPAPRASLGYRTRARLYLKADRRGGVHVGYRSAGSHELAPVDHCAVLDPALAPLVGDLGVVLSGAEGEGDAA